MNRAKAEGSGPADSRKAHHARQRELVIQAEAELQEKQAEQANELRLREHLLGQIALLESVTKENSLADLMHRMVLRALKPAAAAQQATAATDNAAAGTSAEQGSGMGTQPAHAAADLAPIKLEDLPLSLTDFDDELLQRAAEMSLDNCVALYRAFIDRAQFAVSHVKCHGEHSYMNQELEETVARFGNLVMMQSFLTLPFQRKFFMLNFLTMGEEGAPEGWYARIAQTIPVHQDFATLVQAGLMCVQKSTSREFDASSDALKEVRQLINDQGSTDQPPSGDLGHLDYVDSLLDRCERCTNSVLLLRSMLGVYIFSGMMRCFDSAVVGHAMVSCWPYALRSMSIFEEYAKRPEVQALLRQEQPAQGRRK